MADFDVDPEFVKEGEERANLMTLLEIRFKLCLPDSFVATGEKTNLLNALMKHIRENKMAPFYEYMGSTYDWFSCDDAELTKMKAENSTELVELEAKITDAQENLGESEVRDAVQAKAEFFARIGDKENAGKVYEETLEKTVGTGQKIDIMFDRIRLALFWSDYKSVRDLVDTTKVMVEKGGDWERRNRLKVYEATYLLVIREFSEASKLLLESVATFSCYELYSYRRFVLYTVLAATMTQPRNTIRENLVSSPDVLAVIRDVGDLHTYLVSLFKCQYHSFMRALMSVMQLVNRDIFLHEHRSYILREIRVVAYQQFLESYRSVTLVSMASAFGVSPEYLDGVLANFIASGRLNCKIDKVGGVVETNRPDAKNAQYHSILKQGDHLLSRIQKLSRVVNF